MFFDQFVNCNSIYFSQLTRLQVQKNAFKSPIGVKVAIPQTQLTSASTDSNYETPL